MRVNIADIKLEAGSHKKFPVQIAVEAVEMGGMEFQFDRPFTGEAEVWNAGDRLLVQATVSGEAAVQCSRCLAPATMPLTVSFDEEFIEGAPQAAVVDEDDDEIDTEDADGSRNVTYFSGDEIDLSEPLRENVLLELPMKPLCSVDCAGLCPSCGTNLNEGACQCGEETHTVDPRLAALKDLLRKPDTNS
ncbi:MAG TPA: DUF177 domain-containing protein [Symbiobacteriaceae bacterium]|nr:DUF177 domain-containing protein [Symbiobacteriaceae bacterium]